MPRMPLATIYDFTEMKNVLIELEEMMKKDLEMKDLGIDTSL